MLSGFEVKWQLRGQDDELALERFAVAVERLGDGITDFSEFIWPRVVKDLEEELERQFDAEGQGPRRGAWAPLSPKYAMEKAMGGFDSAGRRAQGAIDRWASDRGARRLSKALRASEGWEGLKKTQRAMRLTMREDKAGAMARAIFGGVSVSQPILERTGALRDALTSSNARGARRVMARDNFDFGTTGIEYASFHQVGTANMPDRPPFDFGTQLEKDVTESMKEGVREAMRRSGADEFLSEGAL